MYTSSSKSALITGASSGIGEGFARRLASEGYDVILVARRAELLQNLAHYLETTFCIHAQTLTADLTNPADVVSLEQHITQVAELDYLINSAGFAFLGNFASIPIQHPIDMIACHNLAMVRLCHAALPGMIARRKGYIINVSSIGAFTAKQGDAVYCATKAFTNLFTKTLHTELKGTGVKVQALCPGFILTGFHDTPSYAALHVKQRIPRFIWNTPDELVEKSFRALEHNKVIYVPYFKNQLIVALSKAGFIDLLTAILASFFPNPNQKGAN